MAVEGIRGNEHYPTPEHNFTIPFTRYIAGEADYTVLLRYPVPDRSRAATVDGFFTE